MWISPQMKLVSSWKLITHSRFSSISAAAIQPIPTFEHPPISPHTPISPSLHHFELDADGIVGVLNTLRKKPNDALSFFRQVNHHGFCPDINCYSAIVMILCGSSSERKLYSLFKEIIGSEKKHPHFDVSALFKVLVESFGADRESQELNPLKRVLDVLVKTYAELGMFDDAVDALFQTGRRGLLPCVRSCNYILNCLVDCGKTDMAFSLFTQLKDRLGLTPNVYTYTIVIKACCRKGELQAAIDALKEMQERGITADAYARATFVNGLCVNGETSSGYKVLQAWKRENLQIDTFGYNVVIRGFCNERRLEDAMTVLVAMWKHGVACDEYSYGSIIHGYCEIRNIGRAFALHKVMVSDGVKSNCVIASAILQCLNKMGLTTEVVDYFQWFNESGMFLDEKSYNIVIDALCKLGDMPEAENLLNEMKGKRMVPDAKHYTCFIDGYCRQQNLDSAVGILQEMKEMGVKPDVISYNVLIGELYRHGLGQVADKIIVDMEAEGLKPNSSTYCAIVKGLCRGGDLKEAKRKFDALEEKCASICSVMLKGYLEAYETRKAYELFFHLLSENGILASKSVCVNLLDRLCDEGDLVRALNAFKKMLSQGLALDQIVYSKLIAAICRTGEMRMASDVFNSLVNNGFTPDVITYTTMMNGYCKVNCMQEASDLLNEMKKEGIKPDVITYTVLINGKQKAYLKDWLKNGRVSSVGIKSRTYGASPYLKEVDISDIKPDIVYYTVLLDGHCKAKNLDDASHLFAEIVNRGIIPDAVAYTALVAGYCSQRDVDTAVYLVDEMTSKGIMADTCTISTLEKGFEILEARKVKFIQ